MKQAKKNKIKRRKYNIERFTKNGKTLDLFNYKLDLNKTKITIN